MKRVLPGLTSLGAGLLVYGIVLLLPVSVVENGVFGMVRLALPALVAAPVYWWAAGRHMWLHLPLQLPVWLLWVFRSLPLEKGFPLGPALWMLVWLLLPAVPVCGAYHWLAASRHGAAQTIKNEADG